MPLEIKELQISVTVNQPSAQAGNAAPEAQAGGDNAKAIVQQCIDEVMTIINNKRER